MHGKGDIPEETRQESQWSEVQALINNGQGVQIAELMRRKRIIEQNPFVRYIHDRVAEVTPDITQQAYRDASIE